MAVVRSANNSLDLLRLIAASLVLYSHQFVLLGWKEPTLFNWNTLGGLGVSVFFFLSGYLVWSSWSRDPDLHRFFRRRALRIFPGLCLLVVLTVFLVGPLVTRLSLPAYFGDTQTWRYLGNAVLWTSYVLPGVFLENPYPATVNGSLWTLPVEFFCYGTVAAAGWCARRWQRLEVPLVTAMILVVVLASWLGPARWGERLTTHFEMIVCFWWGVAYAVLTRLAVSSLQPTLRRWGLLLLLASIAIGPRGFERTAVLVCAALLVWIAMHSDMGAILTEKMGDLSYGMYIFAFPVQQGVVMWGRGQDWSFGVHLTWSFVLTGLLAYASWHLLEKKALRLKPS